MEIKITFDIENCKGDKISLTEDEAKKKKKKLYEYFGYEEHSLVDPRDSLYPDAVPVPNRDSLHPDTTTITNPLYSNRDLVIGPGLLEPEIPNPHKVWYSDGTNEQF